ncbi:MAG: TVP38/TMEM64 family protein [Clostridia bacterium]|nr:TVP38/TMEM64 family protein [Clostridia bacterium]
MKSTEKAAPTQAPPMKRSKASIILSIISAVFLGLTALGIWFSREYLMDPALVREKIGEHYLLGAIAMVLISAVQVIVALIPGEFVEIAAGYCFGSWIGSLLCLFGIVLGSCTTILLVRYFGSRFVYAFYPREKIEALPIINDPPKRNMLTFILFVIPGTPKDLFTYAIGLTDMSIPLYVALTTAARFPSVILSTLSGDAVGTKDYTLAVVFVIVTAVVSGVGLLLYNMLLKRKKHKAQKPEEEKE